MKDESTHPTGSLKHRLARSLFLYALCNGDIDRGSSCPRIVDPLIGGVPDAASVAAMQFLAERIGVRAGPSTGTNIYGALRLACELHEHGLTGSVVS